VAIFREPIPQAFHLLAQSTDLLSHLLDHFITLHQLLSQDLIFFAQMIQFFFNRHALTLLGLTPFGKSPADLGSYAASL